MFSFAGRSQWPDENVILHCALNGSTFELSESRDCRDRQMQLVFSVFTVSSTPIHGDWFTTAELYPGKYNLDSFYRQSVKKEFFQSRMLPNFIDPKYIK